MFLQALRSAPLLVCSKKELTYIQYGGECYCGNALNGGGPAPDGDAQCNMPCNGNRQVRKFLDW
jgi:hypothetical protein